MTGAVAAGEKLLELHAFVAVAALEQIVILIQQLPGG